MGDSQVCCFAPLPLDDSALLPLLRAPFDPNDVRFCGEMRGMTWDMACGFTVDLSREQPSPRLSDAFRDSEG